ncbi:MAG: hypothetical protein AB1745_01950 [Pseudomonadota bacterium]|jgi:hypothetical protein
MSLIAAYLFSGALHGLYDIDVTNPIGQPAVILAPVDKGSDQSEKGGFVGHHCHGCFSVSLPAPLQSASVAVEPTIAKLPRQTTYQTGLAPGVDPPPPKYI